MIDGYSIKFHDLLKVDLAKRIERKMSDMTLDMEEREYRKAVGYIEALRDITAECEEIRKKFVPQRGE